MKGKGWLKTQHPRTTSSMQSSRFQRHISTTIYLKVTRISSYLETTNQFQMFQHIITNAWGIPLRALPAENWKAVFAWWHSISKHKQAKKTFSDYLCKATPANDMQLFTKKNFQFVSVRLEITCTSALK